MTVLMLQTYNGLCRSKLTAGQSMTKSKSSPSYFTSLILAGVILFSQAAPALADQYDDKINALKRGIDAQRTQITQLKGQQNTLQNSLATLNAQIQETTDQMALTQARYDKTVTDITNTKQQIATKKALLGENLKTIYQDSQITTIEMLASSGNFGEFVDRAQYLQKMKDHTESTLSDLSTAKQHLDDQQTQLTTLLGQQKGLAYSLSQQKAQSANLLAQTQGQEANYQAKIQSDEAAVSKLRQQQAAEIAARQSRVNYGGTGGYPWAGYALDGGVDPWGFYYRECTSYAAWRRANMGNAIPAWGRMGPADAKTWVGWARNFNMPVDGNPRVGDVAVLTAGRYGHVMIVEQVLGGGLIRVSQYNGNWDGRYSEATISTSGLYFIH